MFICGQINSGQAKACHLRRSQDQDRIQAAEREGIRHRVFDLRFARLIRQNIEITVRVGHRIISGRRKEAVTQGDRCGCDQFNASFLMGGLTASAISHTWLREEDRTTAKIFTSWGSHIGVRAFTNILSEFIGGQ